MKSAPIKTKIIKTSIPSNARGIKNGGGAF